MARDHQLTRNEEMEALVGKNNPKMNGSQAISTPAPSHPLPKAPLLCGNKMLHFP